MQLEVNRHVDQAEAILRVEIGSKVNDYEF